MLMLMLYIAVLGFFVYLAQAAPIAPLFKTVITFIAIVAAIVLLFTALGLQDIPVPHFGR